jgi:hypothetical protein
MSHTVEVDQSGRIDFTKDDTVLAFANAKLAYSILIPATVKRSAIKYIRSHYKQLSLPYIKLFSAALFILLRKNIEKIDTIIIDTEYYGHNGEIRGELLNYIRKVITDFPKSGVVFTQIGKHSPAHFAALETFLGIKKQNRTISLEEIIEVLGK